MAEGHRSGRDDVPGKGSSDGGWSTWLCETVQTVHDVLDRSETAAQLGTALSADLVECSGVAFAWVGTVEGSAVRVRSAPSETSLPPTVSVDSDGTLTQYVESSREVQTVTGETPEDIRLVLEHTDTTVDQIEQFTGIPLQHNGVCYGILHLSLTASSAVDESALSSLGRAVGQRLDLFEKAEKLARERRRLESLRSLVSHDLGTPLNIASGRVELARLDDDTSHLDSVPGAFDRVDELVDRGVRLVEAGQPLDRLEQLSLDTLARDCWDDIGQERGEMVVEDTTVVGDRARIRMLLNELFHNALDYSEGDVSVEVGTHTDLRGFYVADDGPGIPDDELDFVLDTGYTTNPEKRGIGLSIVAEVAGAHGWDVTLDATQSTGTRVEIVTSRW